MIRIIKRTAGSGLGWTVAVFTFFVITLATVAPVSAAPTQLNNNIEGASKEKQAEKTKKSVKGGSASETKNSLATDIPASQNNATIFQRMGEEVEALRRLSTTEAQTTLDLLANDEARLLPHVESLRSRKKALEQTVQELHALFTAQQQQLAVLEEKDTQQGAERKRLEGAVRTYAGMLRERFIKSTSASQLAASDLDALHKLAIETTFPSYDKVRLLARLYFSEIPLQGSISLQQGTIVLPDTTEAVGPVLRIGNLFAVGDAGGETFLLRPAEGGKKLAAVAVSPPASVEKALKEAEKGNFSLLVSDFSQGASFAQYAQHGGALDHLRAGGALVWPIVLLGLIAFSYGMWRILLISRVNTASSSVLDNFFSLAREGEFEKAQSIIEAIPAQQQGPVNSVLLHMLRHWNGTIASLEKCRDEAVLIHLVPFEKGVSFIAVAAALAPLLGLLGTVTGMITTFDTITLFGNNDTKLLSGGISVALVTTELGLIVAIPLMLVHFVLSRKVEKIGDAMEEKSAILVARATIGTGKGELPAFVKIASTGSSS